MTILLVQSSIIWENIEENIRKAEKTISENPGSDMVLFPEMSFTGFSMNTDVTADDSYTMSKMKKMASKYGVNIGFGWVRRSRNDPNKCENVYTVIGKNGEVLSDYVKIHPFSYGKENEFFVAGNSLAEFEIQDIPMTTFICYDLRFPEIFRAVCENTHVIIVPACWPKKRNYHWKSLLRARAIENQVYIIGINCVGNIGGIEYSGDSCIISPNGETLACISRHEGVLKYELNDDIEEFRNGFPVLLDRKPETYDKLITEYS